MNARDAHKRGCFLVTQEGRDAWIARRNELKRTMVTHCASLNVERTRDMDDQQDIERELDITFRSYKHADHVVRNHELVTPATTDDLVDIGTVVTYQEFDMRGKATSVAKTVLIVEYGAGDISSTPPAVAYDNRLIIALLGMRAGHVKEIKLANEKYVEVKVLSISLPTAYPRLKLAA
jgi:hypothetical protein